MSHSAAPAGSELVPDSVIPSGTLPPLKYRDLPEPIPVVKMIGPSIILAGLALGSGEYVFWPYLTYQSKFVFFWAAIVGVITQYFINLEITRWSLATGESAITGFVRLSRHWAWVFLGLNILPWMIPGWARGAAQLASWLAWGPAFDQSGNYAGTYLELELSIASMILCGVVLTAGPVVYETVEKSQLILVSLILLIIVGLAVTLAIQRPDAIAAQAYATVTLGAPDFLPPFNQDVTPLVLLGALAFAGAGGTMNLGQSNYIKDKGYGMGKYIGRITSPITGKEEPISEVGYHFPATETNLSRWRRWWVAANVEHFFSFLMTCIVCLVLLTFISYVLFYDEAGRPKSDHSYSKLDFVWGESLELNRVIGPLAKYAFLVAGIAILLTTELGVLDASSRISTDIVKVSWLRHNARWTEGRLYYLFLWTTILIGSGILVLQKFNVNVEAFALFKLSAAMNGIVMFIYCMLLWHMNRRRLPQPIRLKGWRVLLIAWAILFFGFFSAWAVWDGLTQIFGSST